jgi:hypothetical protein
MVWSQSDPTQVFAASDETALRSSDRGVTFEVMRTFSYGIGAMASLPDGDLLVWHHYTAVWRHEADTGLWTAVGSIADAYRAAANTDGTAWVAAETGLYHYDGTSFALGLPTAAKEVTGLVVAGDAVWVGYADRGVRRSGDQGATWVDVGSPSNRITALELDAITGEVWVATADLGVLRLTP